MSISAQSLAVPILPSQNASKVPFFVTTRAGIRIDAYVSSGENTGMLSVGLELAMSFVDRHPAKRNNAVLRHMAIRNILELNTLFGATIKFIIFFYS
jgi:hypothetical protein